MTPDETAKFIGFDTPRIWATQVTLVPGEESAILVFREAATVSHEEEEGKPTETLIRNVASVVMPMQVIRDLGRVIVQILPTLESAEAETQEDAS